MSSRPAKSRRTKVLQELARTIALERGVELPEPQSDRPQPKKRSYRLTNVTRGADGELTGMWNTEMGAYGAFM
jgi:hypothetical protein